MFATRGGVRTAQSFVGRMAQRIPRPGQKWGLTSLTYVSADNNSSPFSFQDARSPRTPRTENVPTRMEQVPLTHQGDIDNVIYA